MTRFSAGDPVTFEMRVRTTFPDGGYAEKLAPIKAQLVSIDYSGYAPSAMVRTMDGVMHMLYLGRLTKVLPPALSSTRK